MSRPCAAGSAPRYLLRHPRPGVRTMRNLDLALIGDGAIGLLVDADGTIVWGCFARFDGDAIFCALLDDQSQGEERGIYAVEIVDRVRSEQSYVTNTAVLLTRHFDGTGGVIEVTDCVPR